MDLQICKNNLLHIIKSFDNITFDDATKILMNKTNIKTAQNFIQCLQKIISYDNEIIPPKILLSAFFIHFFHKDILLNEENDEDTFIIDKSKQIINNSINLCVNNKINILIYISELNKYKFFFEKWKTKDLSSQLEIYKEMYFKSNFNENIKNKIEKLIGKEKTNELLIITDDNIQKTLRKAFWDILKQDFEHKNYSQVSSIIKDIKYFFCKIASTLKDIMDEYLDEELISVCIETDNFQQLFEILNFCLIELKKLDAPFYDNINTNLQYLSPNTENFISILSFLLERLEFICSFIV